MERNPKTILKELERVQEIIDAKELEVSLLKSKLTKLNIELAETTYQTFNNSKIK